MPRELITARDDPERSFEGHKRETPWDDVHVAYFSGEAMWTYLNTPFLYTQPGFETEEISSIQPDGETWRRLKIVFPESVKSCRFGCQPIWHFSPGAIPAASSGASSPLSAASAANFLIADIRMIIDDDPSPLAASDAPRA